MEFNMEYYRTFYYVSIYKSMTRAANIMSVSQPAVTHAIKKLEESMGCLLFQRMPHGLQLTKEGELLAIHVAAAFRELEIGEQSVSRYSQYETGTLSIGSVELGLYFFLTDALSEFKHRFPKINVSVSGRTNKDIMQSLKEGAVDAAIVIEPLPQKFEFQAIPLMQFQDVFICNRTIYPELATGIHSLSEFADYPLIMLDKGTSGRQFCEEWLQSRGIHLQPNYNIRTSAAILPFVESGLGIGILPKEYIKRSSIYESSHILKIIRTDLAFPARTLYLLTNNKFPKSAICREFVQFAKNIATP